MYGYDLDVQVIPMAVWLLIFDARIRKLHMPVGVLQVVVQGPFPLTRQRNNSGPASIGRSNMAISSHARELPMFRV